MIRELKIAHSMKIYVRRVLGVIKRIINEEKLPKERFLSRNMGRMQLQLSYYE